MPARSGPRWRLAVALIAAAAAAGCGPGAHHHPARHTATATSSPSQQARGHSPLTPPRRLASSHVSSSVTAASAAGVTASWVVDENAKPGDPGWRIPSALPGPAIDGYADATQAVAGDTVRLYVSSAASSFDVEAYRMGYYGGADARLIWTSPKRPVHRQPGCAVTADTNMVSCDWAPSIAVHIDATWPQGDYLLKLVATGGGQSYIPLTIADPASHATYLVQNSLLTWQAWNDYGGYDLYGGGPPGHAPTYDRRARVLSFDRPYSYRVGAADFLGNELPLVEFMEQHGLDVTYSTDIALDEHPERMLDHKAFLSLGHDECWVLPQRDGIIAAIDHGVNAVFSGRARSCATCACSPAAWAPTARWSITAIPWTTRSTPPTRATPPATRGRNRPPTIRRA